MRHVLAAAFALIALSGCVTASGADREQTWRSPEDVDLFYAGDATAPRQPEVLGWITVHADPDEDGPHARQTLEQQLRAIAAAQGADAVMNITFGTDVDHFDVLQLPTRSLYLSADAAVATGALVKRAP